MAIRPSRAGEVERLVVHLRDGTSLQRDAAIARLRVIGPRALPAVAALLRAPAASAAARTGALRALDGVDDPKALALALTALTDPETEVAAAAAGVLRGWLAGDAGTRVLDALTGVALEPGRDPSVRLAALDALSELPVDIVQPVLQRVAGELRAPAAADDPRAVQEWLASHADAPLSALHSLVAAARERERREPSARRRQDWLVTRGVLHAALARRGSTVALYDLRESFDAAQSPLPLDFLAAMHAVGDATCLEPLARAWAAATSDIWWRDRLRETALDILQRGKLTGRHAAVRRVRSRFPGFL